LEGFAEILWGPLFENSENSEEITRNVAAACLGKLSTTNPSKYLPQLHVSNPTTTTFSVLTDTQSCIKDANPTSRATVVAAIRYTFAESSPAFDELLGPILIDFLSLMLDPDLVSIYLSEFFAFYDHHPLLDREATGIVRPQFRGSHKSVFNT
jgi:cullin-associated NEDD8-dissociated protein 1